MPGNQAGPDAQEVELKVGYMTKRSQGKSALGAINFKKRVFVLTPNRLAYFDGTIEVRKGGREKGEWQGVVVMEICTNRSSLANC